MTPQEQLLATFRTQAQTSSASTASATPAEDPFITMLKSQLVGQNGIISSHQEPLSLIKKAQESIASGAQSSAQATESVYGRKIEDTKTGISSSLTAANEAQRGFATNTALLTQIIETGQKQINDLEQRKSELIMSGNAEAAGKIAELQVQEATMMVNNRQQVFQNLLSMAGLSFQEQGIRLQKEQFKQSVFEFDRQMQAKLGETALRYGVELKPGDTVESVIQRAMPRANEMQKLELEDMRLGLLLKNSQIAVEKAQLGKLNRESEDAKAVASALSVFGFNHPFSQGLIESAAKGGNLSTVANLFNEASQPRQYDPSTLAQKALFLKSSGTSIQEAIGIIRTDSSILNQDKAEAILRTVYGKPAVDSLSSFLVKESLKNITSFNAASALGGR